MKDRWVLAAGIGLPVIAMMAYLLWLYVLLILCGVWTNRQASMRAAWSPMAATRTE